MTKSDLENGMVVETRNRDRYLVHNGKFIGAKYYNVIGNNYTNELNHTKLSSYDIVKVYKSNAYKLDYIFDSVNLELIWERKEQPKLSDKDKKKIKVALKKVKEICSSYNNECKKDCEFNVDGLCIFADDPSDFELDNLFKD